MAYAKIIIGYPGSTGAVRQPVIRPAGGFYPIQIRFGRAGLAVF